MKITLEIDDNLDLSVFRNLFFKLLGSDQSTYDLVRDTIMVRLEVSGVKQDQLIVIGIFDLLKSDNITGPISYIVNQLYPMQDIRYQNLSLIEKLFTYPGACSGNLTCSDPSETFLIIEKLLRAVYKVNKLKAFL